MIISLSGSNQEERSVVGKIIQYLTAYYNVEGYNDKDCIEFVTKIIPQRQDVWFEGSGIYGSAQFPTDWRIKRFSEVPNQAYELITEIDYSNLSKENKKERQDDFISFCNHLNKWNPNVLVNALMRNYTMSDFMKSKIRRRGTTPTHKAIKDSYPNWIITDLKYPNEYKAVQKHEHLHIHIRKFKVGDYVTWNESEWEIFECYHEHCLIGLAGLGHKEIDSETEVPYSELSLVNEEPLDYVLNESVVYLDNVRNIEELIEKVKNILESKNIITKD